MKIAIRADASARMGTGHLRRCLSLGHALRALGGEVVFVTRSLGIASDALIAEQGFAETTVLQKPDGSFDPDPAIAHSAWGEVPQMRDAEETAAALAGFAPDWVVVDAYAFDARWHEAVRSRLACRIAVIDDLADRDLSANLVIDHNLHDDHAQKYAGCLTRQARVMGGPRYALLDPAYSEATGYQFFPEVRSIGIFMGGSDAPNFSEIAIEAVCDAGFEGQVEVVTTSANPNLAELRARVARHANAALLIDLPNLAAFFARHDLQIGAGGGATWERCRMGAPTILLLTAENQRAVVPRLAERGIIAAPDGSNAQAIARLTRELIDDPDTRRELSRKSAATVDGKGAVRAAAAILRDSLHLRSATKDDAQLMLDWRNHESNRLVSLDQAPLKAASHRDWLERVLADPARQLFVAMLGECPVGIIRFDFSSDNRAEVSLYLDPALHASGLGTPLLLAGEAASGAQIVDATVLPSNQPSQRMFERCGYEQIAPDKWVKHRSEDRLRLGQRPL